MFFKRFVLCYDNNNYYESKGIILNLFYCTNWVLLYRRNYYRRFENITRHSTSMISVIHNHHQNTQFAVLLIVLVVL